MCGHHGDFKGKGWGYGHHGCGCHGEHHGGSNGHEHGPHFGGHGWAYLTHEERVERLVQAKESLEAQLAEIQKTLALLQPTAKADDAALSAQES
ncbi:Hypothetical protein DEACI_2191 [Acididesulfobacillus acetoxydans]|uniref:DUF5320 domain-containing protein n=1 Tax=Acididesulfobacillus acetoxydans TaxID=1561005 RepID=A0A8S0WNX9_9FIRM|nr:hypothetical protein [Acididesulfobacillus acetoxydans]CAA7601524.1 Hypothetical protein DEACI_2191 [Acididesulfobacillus acetoxydans]CEJ07011.1 Hypothetical protein DEACI_1465 [Acididesulfobacillus acetoxydans]